MLAAPDRLVQQQADWRCQMRGDAWQKQPRQLLRAGAAPDDDRPAQVVAQRLDGQAVAPSTWLPHCCGPLAHSLLRAWLQQVEVVAPMVLEVLDAGPAQFRVPCLS